VLRGDPEGQLAVHDSVGGAIYSVPRGLIDERVWARNDGDQLIVVYVDGHQRLKEVARHQLTTPGRPAISDEHYPPRPAGELERKPRALSGEEQAFLAIGPAAERWLIKAAAPASSACGARWQRRSTLQSSTAQTGSTGRSGHAPPPGDSLMVISPRSWPTSKPPPS